MSFKGGVHTVLWASERTLQWLPMSQTYQHLPEPLRPFSHTSDISQVEESEASQLAVEEGLPADLPASSETPSAPEVHFRLLAYSLPYKLAFT